MGLDAIHFFTGDERSCDYQRALECVARGESPKTGMARRVTVTDSQVTCPDCLANDEWPEIIV
jgi:hypothetical protein